MIPFIYLASQSPRRCQLLKQIGVPCQLLLASTSEDAEALEQERPSELPAHYVVRVTQAKLQAALHRHQQRALPSAPILCADTTVALKDCILGKPRDAEDACRILSMLSGQTHHVLTAVALAWEGCTAYALSTSQVQFACLSGTQISRYIDSQEPFGKAGAYAIQSFAASWIVRIEGSYSGIMGLPLFETCELLKQAHVLAK
jgi:septum formation protein